MTLQTAFVHVSESMITIGKLASAAFELREKLYRLPAEHDRPESSPGAQFIVADLEENPFIGMEMHSFSGCQVTHCGFAGPLLSQTDDSSSRARHTVRVQGNQAQRGGAHAEQAVHKGNDEAEFILYYVLRDRGHRSSRF